MIKSNNYMEERDKNHLVFQYLCLWVFDSSDTQP